MEVQANRFAAGILMPRAPFRADLRARRHFDVSHIAELADRYDVSKEASARRCVDLHDDAIAVVFSRGGVVVRIYRGTEFPRLDISKGDRLPSASLAARAALRPGEVSDWNEGAADQWLGTARGAVCEQTMGQERGSRMTLLTFEPDGDGDAEAVEQAWAAPRFVR